MVLSSLGSRINAALSDFTRSNVVDEKVFDGMLKEICAALLESDVNVRLVSSLRKSIKHKVDFKSLPPGNKRRYIHKVCLLNVLYRVLTG